jgi:hypothetical protein
MCDIDSWGRSLQITVNDKSQAGSLSVGEPPLDYCTITHGGRLMLTERNATRGHGLDNSQALSRTAILRRPGAINDTSLRRPIDQYVTSACANAMYWV